MVKECLMPFPMMFHIMHLLLLSCRTTGNCLLPPIAVIFVRQSCLHHSHKQGNNSEVWLDVLFWGLLWLVKNTMTKPKCGLDTAVSICLKCCDDIPGETEQRLSVKHLHYGLQLSQTSICQTDMHQFLLDRLFFMIFNCVSFQTLCFPPFVLIIFWFNTILHDKWNRNNFLGSIVMHKQ